MKYFATGIAAIYLLILLAVAGSERLPKYGAVKPTPNGCLYIAFIRPNDDSHCKRSQNGQIEFVITPTMRAEGIHSYSYSPDEFDKQVAQFSSTKGGGSRGIPGIAAWKCVKEYLKPTDEIRTFGVLDRGFLVIRNNKIFCLVVTAHNL